MGQPGGTLILERGAGPDYQGLEVGANWSLLAGGLWARGVEGHGGKIDITELTCFKLNLHKVVRDLLEGEAELGGRDKPGVKQIHHHHHTETNHLVISFTSTQHNTKAIYLHSTDEITYSGTSLLRTSELRTPPLYGCPLTVPNS